MKKIKVKLTGIAPLRMNRFTEDAKGSLSGGAKKLSEEEKIQEAYDRTYKDEEGRYYVPARCIKMCILEGGKRVKVGRRNASTDLKAIMFIDGNKVILQHDEEPKVHEDVVRVPPRTGGRVTKYWVYFESWSLEFNLVLFDDRFPLDGLKNSIMEAGLYAGLLDGRPDWGRFQLSSFEVVE